MRCKLLLFGIAIASIVLVAGGASASPGTTTRVSVDSAGNQQNGPSGGYGGGDGVAIRADGRYVAFPSSASNLVQGDTNGFWDVFVQDRDADGDGIFDETHPGAIATERVSVDSAGNQANGPSVHWGIGPSMSDDGRFVAFYSAASNLVSDDTNGAVDIFVRDRTAHTTTRVSVGSDGSQANGESWYPDISADGRYVVFQSTATNLVSGDTNGCWDVFLHDRDADADGVFDEPGAIATERVSVGSGGVQADDTSYRAAVSEAGRYIVFYSSARNLVVSDTNGQADVFVHDRQTGTTVRVSVDSSGGQANAASGDWWAGPDISADGRYVAFPSVASNLVPNDTNGASDMFGHDLQTGETERVSVDSAGNQMNGGETNAPALSRDARYVVFFSDATDLVPSDTNGEADVFVRDRLAETTELVSVDTSGNQGNDRSGALAVSADGRFVSFSSYSSNLVLNDSNGVVDTFVRERGSVYTPTPTPTRTPVPPTSTPTPPPHPPQGVGGAVMLPPAAIAAESAAPAEGSGWSAGACAALGGMAVVIAVGGWYVGRRWLR